MTRNGSAEYRTRACTLCGHDNYKLAPNSEIEFEDGKAAIFVCQNCGMTPYFSTFDDNYRSLMINDYYGIYTFDNQNVRKKQALEKLLDEVDHILPLDGATLLDVGCGEGDLMKAVQDRCAAVRGIEPSPEVVAKLREQGLDAVAGLMQDYKPDQNESWQIVTMFAVLDAMQDPVGDLKRIRALVAEDGILAIRIGSRYRTPFFSSPRFGFGGVVPRMVRAPLDNFRPHRKIEPDFHPFFFTHVTLRAMLSVAGFEVIHCTSQYEGGTRIIARAGAPKKLEDVELEDPIALHQDFIRWQRFDRWIRPIYATLVERPVIALANLVR